MPSEITKVYTQSVPALKFIGKKYGDEDRLNGAFGHLWGQWFENGWFTAIENQYEGNLADVYEDGSAYIGLMREKNGVFEYWLGIFMPEDTVVPEGFTSVDFSAGDLGVCWVYGKESEVYGLEAKCWEKLNEAGYKPRTEWCFERYACRFMEPDENGNIILDICFI